MFKLTIDGKTAVIKTGTSIKLTRENPLVTESGDYTFDVQLPLRGCPENIEIFGALYRPEVSISAVAGRRLPFTLITDVFSISGKAVVTSVTQDEAKVQLLAGRSELNESTKNEDGDDIYIDELDLGRAWDNKQFLFEIYENAANTYGEDWDLTRTIEDDILFEFMRQILLYDYEYGDMLIHNDANEEDFVAFPVYSLEDGKMANSHAVHHYNIGGENERFAYCFKDLSGYHGKLAAQPYLVTVLERILNALGFSVASNQIRQSWMRNVFIANSKNCLRVKKILPHWTVEEFLEEIENFFGCFIDINNNIATIKTYENSLNGLSTNELHEVVDETSCDIDINDNERLESMITGNIEYAEFFESKILRLPDEVWEKAIVKIFDTKTELDTWINENLNNDDIEKSKYLFCVREENNVYAHLLVDYYGTGQENWQLVEVDICPSLIRTGRFQKNRDIDITLRITPCLMYDNTIDYNRSGGASVLDYFTMNMPLSPESRFIGYSYDYSVNDAIMDEEDDDKEEKSDVIPVAWNTMLKAPAIHFDTTTQQTTTVYVSYAVGLPRTMINDYRFEEAILDDNNIDNLCLSSRDFANTRFSQNLKTNVVRQFSFTDNINPEPLAIYLIRGKRYLCQKIELTIDEKGLNPLKKGYFYELN